MNITTICSSFWQRKRICTIFKIFSFKTMICIFTILQMISYTVFTIRIVILAFLVRKLSILRLIVRFIEEYFCFFLFKNFFGDRFVEDMIGRLTQTRASDTMITSFTIITKIQMMRIFAITRSETGMKIDPIERFITLFTRIDQCTIYKIFGMNGLI